MSKVFEQYQEEKQKELEFSEKEMLILNKKYLSALTEKEEAWLKTEKLVEEAEDRDRDLSEGWEPYHD